MNFNRDAHVSCLLGRYGWSTESRVPEPIASGGHTRAIPSFGERSPSSCRAQEDPGSCKQALEHLLPTEVLRHLRSLYSSQEDARARTLGTGLGDKLGDGREPLVSF